jgi:hypothetical protein
MSLLQQRLPDRVHVVTYEALVHDCAAQVAALWEWLKVEDVPVDIPVRTSSLDRWRNELSSTECREIEAITGLPAVASRMRLEGDIG